MDGSRPRRGRDADRPRRDECRGDDVDSRSRRNGGDSAETGAARLRYRAWPPVHCGDSCGPRAFDLAADAGLRALHAAHATPLAEKQWRFLRSLDRDYFASGRAVDVEGADRDAFARYV